MYTGMVVDTFCCTISIKPEKKVRLAAFLEGFFDLQEASFSDLVSFRGRHCSACLPYVLPFVALFPSVIDSLAHPNCVTAQPVLPKSSGSSRAGARAEEEACTVFGAVTAAGAEGLVCARVSSTARSSSG